ncbi:FAD-dependent oxidoreductase [Amycolatopsis sp. NPDC051758]|uniref:FAD-dependent oxidoreductase n=1 Tax=Amycolatopsis sp. NPDC051758 TaxID=3363935 RepID=UPI00378882EA
MSDKVIANCDVLVIGSGAAGIAAALRAAHDGHSVVVVEKEPYLGGTTAISGGWLWVPGNEQGMREGDTRADTESYLKHLAGDRYAPEKVKAFLDEVPEAMRFFADDAGIVFQYPEKAPDYRREIPGARVSGRAVTVRAADARMLGRNRLRVQPYLQSYTVFGYMPEIGMDIAMLLKANQNGKAFAYAARKLTRTWPETLLHQRAYLRTNGNALMTRMIAAADELGVDRHGSFSGDTRVTQALLPTRPGRHRPHDTDDRA